MAIGTPKRRRRRRPRRLPPRPAGSPAAIELVRGFIGQGRRHRNGRDEIELELRRHERGTTRRLD